MEDCKQEDVERCNHEIVEECGEAMENRLLL